MDCVRSCQKRPLCLMEPMPAGCKADPPLAEAEPISDGGSTSGVTNSRRGKKLLHNSNFSQERGVRLCERNNSADPKVNAEGGEEVLQVPEHRFPCSPWSRPW